MPKSDQGVSADRYNVIPRALIFVTRGDQVLLIKGSKRKRLWANRYNGVGGHIERGEDILTAARRELREETGLEVINLWNCGTVMVDASDTTGIAIFVFKGEYKQGVITASEEGQLEWINISEADRLPLVEDLIALLPRVMEAKRGDAPFSARSFYDENERLILQFS